MDVKTPVLYAMFPKPNITNARILQATKKIMAQ
jgi:hypothetical protein